MLATQVRLASIMDAIAICGRQGSNVQEITLYKDAGGNSYCNARVRETNFSRGKFTIECDGKLIEIPTRDVRIFEC